MCWVVEGWVEPLFWEAREARNFERRAEEWDMMSGGVREGGGDRGEEGESEREGN
jgi:hypothetical protein